MTIGSSKGAFYEDEFHWRATKDLPEDGVIKPQSQDKMEISPNELMPEGVDPNEFETPLSPVEENNFQDWKAHMAPNDSGHDYDFRGAFKAGIEPAENGHWPDTFKKPNHPTFSDQSQYATDRPDLAGTWNGDMYISPKAIPIANITNTPDEIMSGLEGVRAWQNRGVAGPTQMRRGANDNNKDLYNPREPSMIGDKKTDAEILKSFQDMGTRFEMGSKILDNNAKLMNILKERPWTDLEKARFDKNNRLHKEHFGDYYPE